MTAELPITKSVDLTAPIVWKDEPKRIVYGPVLIPDVKDSDGDVISVDKIEAVAHKFLEEYRLMEHMHTLKSIAHPVESYLAPTNLQFGDVKVPKGSWIVGAKINDDDAWGQVQKGELAGFSIVAVPTGATKSETAVKKLTLRDIEASGQDWEVIAIGLVDQPAVPLAKWVSVKREEESTWDRLKSTLFTPKDKQEATREDIDMDAKELKELVTGAVEEATKPLNERIDALEKSAKEAAKKPNEEPVPKAEDEKPDTISKEDLAKALETASEEGAKKAMADLLDEFDGVLEKKKTPSFKSLAESLRGQDGHIEKKSSPSRDAFGRRVREKEGAKS